MSDKKSVRTHPLKTRTGSLAAYFVLSFAIAVPVFWLYTRQTALLAQLLLLILGSYAPTISALAVVMLSHDPGGAAFWQRLRNWRASKRCIWWRLSSQPRSGCWPYRSSLPGFLSFRTAALWYARFSMRCSTPGASPSWLPKGLKAPISS